MTANSLFNWDGGYSSSEDQPVKENLSSIHSRLQYLLMITDPKHYQTIEDKILDHINDKVNPHGLNDTDFDQTLFEYLYQEWLAYGQSGTEEEFLSILVSDPADNVGEEILASVAFVQQLIDIHNEDISSHTEGHINAFINNDSFELAHKLMWYDSNFVDTDEIIDTTNYMNNIRCYTGKVCITSSSYLDPRDTNHHLVNFSGDNGTVSIEIEDETLYLRSYDSNDDLIIEKEYGTFVSSITNFNVVANIDDDYIFCSVNGQTTQSIINMVCNVSDVTVLYSADYPLNGELKSMKVIDTNMTDEELITISSK